MKKSEYDTALKCFKESLTLNLESLPSNHSKIATDFNNLATIYYDIGQYRRALEFFN